MVVSPDLISRGLAATDLELGLGAEEKFRVFIRDETFNRVDQLKEWLEFSYIKRFNNVGTWRLRIAANSLAAQTFRENYGIIVTREVEGTELVDFSGSIGSEWEETSEYISMAGWCDNKLLETTARPTPNLAEGPYPDAYFTYTGIASQVMRELVVRNIGPGAPSAWVVPGLDISDANPVVGGTITARARFDTLLVLLRELASTPIATGLGFRIQQADDVSGQLEFQIYIPRDNHIDTVFSTELQTARDYKRVYVQPSANYFQVGGGDDFGISRTIVEGGDEVSIAEVGRRIPIFVDRRGVTDLAELEQELAELIAGAVSSNTITIIPTDIPAYQYGVNYDLGDYVTAVVRGVSYPRLIRDIEVILSPDNGVSIIPTISDPYGDSDDILAQHLNTLENRLSNIERNWNVPDNSLIPAMFHETIRDYLGDLKLTARASAQPAWLICDGSAISRSVYSGLFAAIGTLYGAGDGSSTFNIPDFRGRMPIGVGLGYGLGERDGADTLDVDFGSHSHGHSHGGGSLVFTHTHNSQAHTHSQSHSHGLAAHRHTHSHAHPFSIIALETGRRNNDTVGAFGFDEPNVSSGTEDHHHNVEDYFDNTDQASPSINTSDGEETSGGGSFDATEQDTNDTGGATYTGSPSTPNGGSSWSGGTEDDDTEASVGGSGFSVKNTFQTVNFEIYAGVEV